MVPDPIVLVRRLRRELEGFVGHLWGRYRYRFLEKRPQNKLRFISLLAAVADVLTPG